MFAKDTTQKEKKGCSYCLVSFNLCKNTASSVLLWFWFAFELQTDAGVGKGGQGQHRVVHQSKAWHTLQCIEIQFSLWLKAVEILCTLHFNLLTRCTLRVQIADLSAHVMHQLTASIQHIQLTLCSLEWCCIVSNCRIQLHNSTTNSYYRTLLQNSTRVSYHWILYAEFNNRILLQNSTTESYCRFCNAQIAQIDGEQAASCCTVNCTGM